MTTIRQLDRLWNAKEHSRLVAEIAVGRPELLAVARHLLGPVAAAAVGVIRLDELGQAHQPLSGRLIRTLLASQHEDGSWGDLAVTVLALRALRCGGGSGQAVQRALDFLQSQQELTGGWPYQPVGRMPPDPLMTAFVLLTLADDPMIAARLSFPAAAAWLRGQLARLDAPIRRLAERAIRRVHRDDSGSFFNAANWS
ncbi:MAG: hypothetical protein RMJ35_11160 [Phycisphaerales bacterium]|nr:hypothetical protein [Phycisphaerales bacterium]